MENKPLERLGISATNRPVEVVSYWKSSGGLLLDPPYQRGDVWGKIRQRNLIKSIIQGIPIPSIIINDRASSGWDELIDCAVIDGKQRVTAILSFLESELVVPAYWFGLGDGDILFKDLPLARQRGFKHTPIPFAEGQLGSLEAEQDVFELVNFGGVPQGESDF